MCGGGGGVTQFTLVITRDVSRSDCGKNSNCITYRGTFVRTKSGLSA